MAKTSVDERRADQRHITNLTIQGTPEGGGIIARMVARNLSAGGLYCTSTTDFPEMTRLAVRLMLPLKQDDVEPVDLEAVVVRREEIVRSNGRTDFELALYFTGLDAPTKMQLERFLGQRKD